MGRWLAAGIGQMTGALSTRRVRSRACHTPRAEVNGGEPGRRPGLAGTHRRGQRLGRAIDRGTVVSHPGRSPPTGWSRGRYAGEMFVPGDSVALAARRADHCHAPEQPIEVLMRGRCNGVSNAVGQRIRLDPVLGTNRLRQARGRRVGGKDGVGVQSLVLAGVWEAADGRVDLVWWRSAGGAVTVGRSSIAPFCPIAAADHRRSCEDVSCLDRS